MLSHRGNFSFFFSSSSVHPLRSSYLSLEAQIPALRLKSQPQGPHGWTDRRTNKSPPVFYRTSSPSGPLPCYPSPTITNIQSRATGIADHILPLGDWFTAFYSVVFQWICRKLVTDLKTRPDTRQSSRGRLGRSSNAKTARNSKM